MENRNLRQLEGLFLSFSPDDLADIFRELERRGYPADADGVKSFIFDELLADEEAETPSERFTRRAKNYVIENPDMIRDSISAAVNMLRAFGSRK